jgi:hypothetical protein
LRTVASRTAAKARAWGGPGVGVACAICNVPVGADEAEFEIGFSQDGDDPGLHKYHVHIPCFAAWEFEREASGPTCDICLMRVQANQRVIFRSDGRMEHVECPVMRCIRCLRPVQADESTERIGGDVVHRHCPGSVDDDGG